jgi:hypothetical protein
MTFSMKESSHGTEAQGVIRKGFFFPVTVTQHMQPKHLDQRQMEGHSHHGGSTPEALCQNYTTFNWRSSSNISQAGHKKPK